MKRRTAPLSRGGLVPTWWQPLFDACGSESIFLSSDWIQTWLEVYGEECSGVWVYWEDDGVVLAGCLLIERVMRVKGIPFRSLFVNLSRGPLEPLAEFNEILCLPGHRDVVAHDLAAFIKARPWARLLLCGYEPESVCARLLTALAAAHIDHEHHTTGHVNLQALDDKPFASNVKGRAGTYVRRNLREYEQRLGSIAVSLARDRDEALRFFEEMRSLHVERWQNRGKSTTMASPAVVAFHRRLVQSLWPGRVELLRVGTADFAVGYLYNFVVRKKVFVFQTGFTYDALSKWSPGLLTHAMAIEHYRQRGMWEYDLLSGDAHYKRTLRNGKRDLIWSVVYRDRLWIRLLLTARRLKNKFAKR